MSIADISEDRLGGPREHERTPPHDILAEQSALGGMLLSKDAVADVIETLRGADFYIPKHELIFEAILTLYSHGEPTDVITVTDELIKTGELQRAGEADLIVAKHRNGPTDTITVAFQGHYSRFADMAPGDFG